MEECGKDNAVLKRWTCMRVVVMGGLMMIRIEMLRRHVTWSIRSSRLSATSIRLSGQSAPNCQRTVSDAVIDNYPNLTTWIDDNKNVVVRLFSAGWLFLDTEGIGLMRYFATTGLLDNYTIYFAKNVEYCEYVTQVALYSMAVVACLPTVLIAYFFQGRWYDGDNGPCSKLVFIVLMLVVTAASFIIQLILVYGTGWDELAHEALTNFSYKIVIALLVPPAVDGLQALLLFGASSNSPSQP